MSENEPAVQAKAGRSFWGNLAVALAVVLALGALGVSLYVAVVTQEQAAALRQEEERRTEALLKALEAMESRPASPAPEPTGDSAEALRELTGTLRAFRESLDRWPPAIVNAPASEDGTASTAEPAAAGPRPVQVAVLGAVRRPGAVSAPPGGSLAEFIALAGGPADNAAGEIVVRRKADKEGEPTVVARIKLADALALAEDVELRAGDVVYVAEQPTGSVFVLGEVKSPGAFPWTPGATVFQAVVRAGGFTKYANRNSITIARTKDGQVEQIRATGNTELLRDDVVFVTESWF